MKRGRYILIFFLIVIIITPLVFAGLLDWFKKITGEAATEGPLDINITVGAGNAPNIIQVWNGSSLVTLNDGPSNTNLSFNFSVEDADGASNIKEGSAAINITKSGVGRLNNTCVEYESSGNFANYTCNVTMWWWDADGVWAINATISDNNDNNAANDTTNITINLVTGFVTGPGNLTWTTLDPDTTNQTPSGASDNWVTLNNTGNQDVATHHVQINATDLKGETTPTQALWAANFSVGPTTGSAKPECDLGGSTATNMTNGTSGDAFKEIYNAVLPAGNYTINTNSTGQENLYICIQKVGLGLSQQRYSTVTEGAWTIKID
jgi:hypothetical protein